MPYYPPSNGGSNSSVVAKYSISSSYAVLTDVQIDFDNQIIDTNSAVTTGATWNFAAPTSGNYRVSVVGMNTAVTASMVVWKNGAAYDKLVTVLGASTEFMSGTTIIPLAATDYIDIRCDSPATWLGGSAPFITEISIESV